MLVKYSTECFAQVIYFGYGIGEVTCPAKYFEEASSINFSRSVKYGFGVLWTSLRFRLQRWHLCKFRIFNPSGRKLPFVEETQPYYSAAIPSD